MTCDLVLNIFLENIYREIDLSILNKNIVTLGKNKNNDIIINSNTLNEYDLIFELNGKDCFIGDLGGQGILYKGNLIKEKRLELNDIYIFGQGKKVTILITKKSAFDNIYNKFSLDAITCIRIGKDETNDIIFRNDLISDTHAQIFRDELGELKITDLKSRNGVFINGKRITEVFLKSGDIINVLGNKIIFNEDYLSINNLGNGVWVNNLEPYIPVEKATKSENGKTVKRDNRVKVNYPYIQRSPRFIPEVPSGVIEVTNPPFRAMKPDISWLSVLLPAGTMFITTLVMMLVTKGGAYVFVTLGMTVVSVFVSIHNYQSQLKKYKTDEAKRSAAYLDYINKIKNELEDKRNGHQKALNDIHPDFGICLSRVTELNRKLWERTPLNDDFLDIRIGRGSEALKVNIKVPRQEITIDEDPLLKEPQKLADEFRKVENVPICLSLVKDGTVGIIGSRSKMNQAARNIAVQIAAAHSYDEVKMICIFPENEAADWEWMRWLPHTWDDNKQVRFMAKDKKTANKILAGLYDLIKSREMNLKTNSDSQECTQMPYLVFFLADKHLLRNEPIMSYLIQDNKKLGISSLFFFESLEELPKDCQGIVDMVTKKSQLYKRESLNSKVAFNLDQMSISDAEKFARKIAPIRLKQIAGSTSLPNRVTFLDIFNTKKIKELDILKRWEKNKAYKTLAVPLGERAGNGKLILDIHEKSHGPHGLVAGTTGSGKSELLQTFILALAVNYHPHDVSFVLIDYKGGGMANSFKGLPHLVGTITNLGGNETRRALLSIKSEIKKRQTILGKYGLNNIDQYIPFYKEKKADVPLPHLIIIADEFAELKAEQPDFMKELVSTARVGRSLGVHLILATQKPSGVVDDQIWSNSKFKLCLKVQETSDSQEVIKRPDAAHINITGRGFIQVGNNEMFEEFQSAWSGAEYFKNKGDYGNNEINIISLDGSKRKLISNDNRKSDLSNPTQLKQVVEYIKMLALDKKISPLKGPWLPTLPERLFLQDIIKDIKGGWKGKGWSEARKWLSPIIGLMDNPSEQEQGPLALDLGQEGHIAVYGAPGTGKTNLILTLLTSLTLTYNPEEVNIYILDFGSRGMGIFMDAPHVGGIVFPEEDAKLSKLCKLLKMELESRKHSFSEFGVSNLPTYINASGRRMPAIVLVVDNYSALSEMYPDMEEILVSISREGGNYGIHLVLTANSTSAIRYRVSQNIKLSIALQMTDKGDYISIVGRNEGLEPDNIPGRGLIKFRPPLEIQIALPIIAETQFEMVSKMKSLFKEMAENWQGRKAKPIPVLPDILTISEIMKNDDLGEICKSQKLFVPIGLDIEDMRPVGFDLGENHCFMISVAGHSEGADLLKSIAILCSDILKSVRGEFYLIDSPAGGLADIAQSLNVAGYITESTDLTDLISGLVGELNVRKKDLNQGKRCSQVKFDEKNYIIENYPCKVLLIDNLLEFIEKAENEAKDNFERIVRFGKGLGVYVFITGQAVDINKLNQIDTLTKAIIDLQKGVILGGTFEDHSFYNLNVPYQERDKILNKGEGYFIDRGKYKKSKIIAN